MGLTQAWAWGREKVPVGAASAVAVRALNPVLAFVITALLARVLGAGAYGDYLLAATTVSLLSLVAVLGLDVLTPRVLGVRLDAADPGGAARFLRWSTRTVLLMSAGAGVAMVAVLAVNPMQWTDAQRAATLIVLAGLPAIAGLRIARARLQAVGRTATGLAFEMLAWNALLLLAGLALLAQPAWRDVRLLAAAHAAAATLAWIGAVIALRRHLPRAPGPGARTDKAAADKGPSDQADHAAWRRASLTFGLYAVVLFALTGGDVVIVGTLLSPHDTGLYGVAARVAALGLLVLQPLQLVATPRLAKAWARGDKEGVSAIARQTLGLSVLASLAFAAAAWLAGPWALQAFGQEFVDAAWALRWLSLAQLGTSVMSVLGIVLRMVHEERAAASVLLAAFVLAVPMMVGATLVAGVTGAALARLLAPIGIAIGFHVVLVRRTGLRVLTWGRVRPNAP